MQSDTATHSTRSRTSATGANASIRRMAARASQGSRRLTSCAALHIAHFALRGGRITRTGGATDEGLRRGALLVHRLGQIVGGKLSLGGVHAVQLSSGSRTLLVYAPGAHQLCGVLGDRRRVWPIMQKAGLDLEEGGAPLAPLRTGREQKPLGGLADVDGVIGGWIGVANARPWASTMPSHFAREAIAQTTQALRRLFQCAHRIGLPATGAELLFGRHRIVVAGFSRGCVAALAAKSANDRVVLGATRELARRADASCWLERRFHDANSVFSASTRS